MTDTAQTPDAQGAAIRRYLVLVLSAILAIALGLAVYAQHLGPPSGDLVRIGGWGERIFGWQGEKRGFAQNHFEVTYLPELLAEGAAGDVLVFGDSISIQHEGNITWINTLHEQTGLPVQMMRIKEFTEVVAYLDSETFRSAPPAAIVIQTVERAALRRARGIYVPTLPCAAPEGEPASVATLAPGATATVALSRKAFSRRQTFDNFDEIFSWGALALRKRLEGETKALPITLSRGDLFSSRVPDRGLIYVDDVRNYTPEAFAPDGLGVVASEVICGLRQLVTRSGEVPIRVMVAPDKRSLYAPWITTPLPAKQIDVFAVAQGALGAMFIDLMEPLRDAVETHPDIYYPNDTHWGPVGHEIAGMRVADSLR